MSKYQRRGWWTIRIRHPLTGDRYEKATGTKDAALADRYATMCAVLGDRPADHVFLIAVCDGRLDLSALYAHWAHGKLGALRTTVEDVDLTEHLKDWRAQLVTEFGEPTHGEGQHSAHTVTQYTKQVGAFFIWAGSRPLLSHYTVEKCGRWLNSRPVSSARKRRYWAALKSFGRHLRNIGLIPRDQEPLAGLDAPPAGKPRDRHLTEEERDRLIAACSGEITIAETLAHMGIEMGAIRSVRVRDVDLSHGTVRIRGSKNRFRDRIGVIPAWAQAHLREAVRHKLPDARLVTMGASKIRAEHQAACKALGISNYRFHDARHTFAVDLLKKGFPSSVIGLQLGHKDGTQVEQVYGRHRATTAQLKHWFDVTEGTRTARDKRSSSNAGAPE